MIGWPIEKVGELGERGGRHWGGVEVGGVVRRRTRGIGLALVVRMF